MRHTGTNRDYISRVIIADRSDTTLTGSYVSQGEIDVSNIKSLTIFPKWTKGDETSAELKVVGLYATGGTEHQFGDYTDGSGVLSQQAKSYQFTTASTDAVPIELDITNYIILKIYVKATGGTPDGKMKIDCIGSNSI